MWHAPDRRWFGFVKLGASNGLESLLPLFFLLLLDFAHNELFCDSFQDLQEDKQSILVSIFRIAMHHVFLRSGFGFVFWFVSIRRFQRLAKVIAPCPSQFLVRPEFEVHQSEVLGATPLWSFLCQHVGKTHTVVQFR